MVSLLGMKLIADGGVLWSHADRAGMTSVVPAHAMQIRLGGAKMKNIGIRFVLAALCIVALATVGVVLRADDDEGTTVRAKLSGFQEAAPTPKLTTGSGDFRGTIAPDDRSLTFTLRWSNLTGAPLVAHFHFAQRGVSGAVVVNICGTPGKPACGGATGSITGTAVASDVQSVPAQGFVAGDFAGFLRTIRNGVSYVNIHTATFPAGEIRGQVRAEEGHDRD